MWFYRREAHLPIISPIFCGNLYCNTPLELLVVLLCWCFVVTEYYNRALVSEVKGKEKVIQNTLHVHFSF